MQYAAAPASDSPADFGGFDSASTATRLLFVYGTLQRGGANDISRYRPAPRWLGHGWVRGRLFDLGHCPALVPDAAGTPVWGEVYAIDAALFEALDGWEAECGDFRLASAEVTLAEGPLQCLLYVAGAAQALPAQPMAASRWPARRRLQPRQLIHLGDSALMACMAHEPAPLRLPMVHGFAQAVRALALPAVLDVVEAPDSVTVHYAPQRLGRAAHPSPDEWLRAQLLALAVEPLARGSTEHVLPVCYEPEVAPDLVALAAESGLSVQQLVALHSGAAYTVAALGFLPGFAYLEGLPAALHAPRLATPRSAVPEGSVAIGNEFTGIYPAPSPGGWRLIGRTPARLFDPARTQPSLFKAGDRVRFERLSLDALAARQAAAPC